MLTQEELKECLDYNPETGEFTWKWRDDVSNNVNGKLAGRKANTIMYNAAGPCIHIGLKGRKYLGHRLAWLYVYGEMPQYIDHRNGDRIDNRIENLRPCTMSQNLANSYQLDRGIEKHGRKFRARINVNWKRVELGSFNSYEEAQCAYNEAADKYYGEFARTNR